MERIVQNRSDNFLVLNNTGSLNGTLPEHLQFNEYTLTIVLIYSALFVVAAVGNLSVFISLFKSRHKKSRISLMIKHLAVADLIVTFIMIPIEVGWRLTVQWVAGNLACKIFSFLRAFGLYLSSNVLVCVSLDRYFAVLHPLRVNDARRRGKIMLACAWCVSLVYSIPQSVVFRVSSHPEYSNFHQCVSFGFFNRPVYQTVYSTFGLVAMYFVPLLVIVVAYSTIMCEITKKSKETKVQNTSQSNGRMTLRRSDIKNIARARTKTLKMTITIVAVFVWCWTPYVVVNVWYMVDKESVEKLSNWLKDGLFMMAVSNSCMNPIVYGSYVLDCRKECTKSFCCGTTLEEPALTRKSTDADMMLAPTEQSGLTRRVIKRVLALKNVGSVTTKSTCGVVKQSSMFLNRSPQLNNINEKFPVSLNHKSRRHTMERPISTGYISTLADCPKSCDYITNCHSDPYPCLEDRDNDSTNLGYYNPRDKLNFTRETIM